VEGNADANTTEGGTGKAKKEGVDTSGALMAITPALKRV